MRNMMKWSTLLIALMWLSCNQQPTAKDFNEKIVDFTIENADTTADKMIELPRLYDTLAREIPDDRNEKLIPVEILKKQGFKVTNSGRGNFPLGARIISVTLQKGGCECRVDKMYYNTMDKGYYEMRESIQCKKRGKK